MATNILALPLVEMQAETGNNEDWIDSVKFLVFQEGVPDEDLPQLDLRGIDFEMEVRRSASDHEVILSASTKDTRLSVGAPPDYGFLIIYVPLLEMKTLAAGEYIADVRAFDDDFIRVCIHLALTIVEGVTKSP